MVICVLDADNSASKALICAGVFCSRLFLTYAGLAGSPSSLCTSALKSSGERLRRRSFKPILFYFGAFVVAAVGADAVGAGGLMTIGTGDKCRKGDFVSGPAFALAMSGPAAFRKWSHVARLYSLFWNLPSLMVGA